MGWDSRQSGFRKLLNDVLLAKGEDVFTVGFPLIDLQGQAPKATFGRVNALSGPRDDADFVQIDVPTQPGISGGPLLDPSGRVVGVVTATLDQAVAMRLAGTFAQNVNYAIQPDILKRFLIEGRTRPSSLAAGGEPAAELRLECPARSAPSP